MVLLVIRTPKGPEEFYNSSTWHCILKLKESVSIDTDIIFYNKSGLSNEYNKVLNNYSLDSYEYIVFMHDDVEIHDVLFYEKLKKAHEKYDVVGLAGAKQQNYTNAAHSLWHVCSPKDQLRGIVSHFIPHEGGYCNSVFFGPTPSSVVVIDGLFISVNPKKLKEKGVQFDEQFKFHHYDLAFCVDCNKKGVTMGVWPIFVVHHGLGEFNSQEWQDNNIIFLDKFKDYSAKI